MSTFTIVAEIIQGTVITVIARVIIIGVHAVSRVSIARIIGTRVVIVAFFVCTCTFSFVALIILSASIVIIARSGVVGMYAVASVSIARIIGTRVVIVTVSLRTSNTISLVTTIVRTKIIIGAGSIVPSINTFSVFDVTVVVGTDIIIIAYLRSTSNAVSIVTLVV
jgi:hypothetical protein